MRGPRRRWKFGPAGAEETAPPPRKPQDEPSFNSAAVERAAEAHFTPGPEALAPAAEEETSDEELILPPRDRDTNIQ